MNHQPIADEQLTWEAVSVEHVVQDEWIDFRKVRYRFPDGREFEPYYQYSRRDYVVIAAEDEDGNLICVRQFRHGIGRVTVEFPAGGIETEDRREGQTMEEIALETAKRELAEETGYVSDDWTHLITVPSNATIADNDAYLYYAKNCRRVSEQKLDDTEYLEPERYRAEQIEELIASGRFAQAIHIMAWLMIKERMR